jgi:hypothetical protein
MFAYPCPACRQRLIAPTTRVGQRSICPKCLHPLTVPHPEQVAAGGPFSPSAPSPDEPYTPDGELVPEGSFDTPIPMNTMPARPGEVADQDAKTPLTEPFLDLAPASTDTPTAVEAVALVAPPSTPKPAPRSTRRPTGELDGRVAFDPSTLFAGDAVAQLSAAISMRMAPPPLPTTDRTYAIIGWLAGTLVGLGVWVMAVFQSAKWGPYVALVGGAMVAFGLLWRAYLSGRGGSWAGGLITLLPPVCLVQLLRPVAGAGLRPLWFVLSGVGLLGLFAAVGPVKKWSDETFEPPVASSQPDVDPDATAALLDNKADRESAKRALVKAGVAAEPAVRKLLTAKADGTVIAACDVLGEIGTAESVPALRKLADDTPSKAVRIEAATAADAIQKRLSK